MRRLGILSMVVMFGCSEAPRDPGTASDAGSVEADGGVRDGGPGAAPACEPMFADTEACGGDVVDGWSFVSVCGTIKAVKDFQATCPELELVRQVLTPIGGFTARDVGTYVIDGFVDFDVDVELPVSCVQDIGGCGPFAFVIQLAISGTATCNQVADECHCTVVGREIEQSAGSYVVSGGTFTSSSSGSTSDYWFCRQGDYVTLREMGQDVVFVFGK